MTDSSEIKMSDYVCVRSRNAGVFVGKLTSRTGDEVELSDARRIWYWSGAASLSELCVRGVSNPGACKFPVATPRQTIFGVIEIIPVSAAALSSIQGVEEWSQH